MELLKSIVVDFVLFSSIEGFIFCLFFEKIGKCRKFKWYEWLLLSIGNCVISQVFPPTIYQIICVIWLCFILYKTNKLNVIKSLKLALSSICLFFIVEILYSILIELTTLKDLILLDNNFVVFVYLIPAKILEIIICLKGDRIMKIVVGGVVRK